MKIIFKTETEILKEVEFDKLTSDIQNELKESFDNKPILKYEITFKAGVFVMDCHKLEDISDKQVSILTITIDQISNPHHPMKTAVDWLIKK